MYAGFVKHISFPFYQWWYGSNHYKDLRKQMYQFDQSQWLSPEQLKAIQWDRLKKLITYSSQNIPYYQEAFKALGATPNDFNSLEDFSNFPTLTKQTIQERLQDLIAVNMPRKELLWGTTSGSSGQPTIYCQGLTSNLVRKAAGRRLNQIVGYDFGRKVFSFWRDSQTVDGSEKTGSSVVNDESRSTFLRKIKQKLHDSFGLENPMIREDPSILTEYQMAKLYNRLKSYRPDIIISYVNALYLFAKYLESENLSDLNPSSIIVSSETLYPHQRELMEKAFGCPVYNRYGLQETGIVAIECPYRDGLHINQEILFVEYVPNTVGESQLVITDLINYAMPLLRYETGDIGNPLTGACPCGRGLERIGQLEGRIIELLPSKLGGYVNGQLFATFHWIKGIKQYQVIQEQLNRFRISIVRTPEFEEENLYPILNTIHEKFGSETSITVEKVKSIPFTKGGKYKLVVSEVEKNL